MATTPGDPDTPFVPAIRLDRDSAVPLYRQIAEPLEDAILSGALPPGHLIEDEVSMAHRLQVSRPTARRALQDLVGRGLLTRRRGAGTRVTPSHVRRPLSLTSLNDDLLKAGFDPRTEVLSYEVLLATDQDASRLGCPTGSEVVRIRRRRWIDDRRLALLTNLLPADLAPSLTQLTSTGLYTCLREAGILMASATQSVGARSADATTATLLGLTPGDALLTMERTAYDPGGSVVEYGQHVYNADLYSFQFTLVSE